MVSHRTVVLKGGGPQGVVLGGPQGEVDLVKCHRRQWWPPRNGPEMAEPI